MRHVTRTALYSADLSAFAGQVNDAGVLRQFPVKRATQPSSKNFEANVTRITQAAELRVETPSINHVHLSAGNAHGETRSPPRGDPMTSLDAFGYFAASLVLATFCARSMVTLGCWGSPATLPS
jgi:hypothetical protein